MVMAVVDPYPGLPLVEGAHWSAAGASIGLTWAVAQEYAGPSALPAGLVRRSVASAEYDGARWGLDDFAAHSYTSPNLPVRVGVEGLPVLLVVPD